MRENILQQFSKFGWLCGVLLLLSLAATATPAFPQAVAPDTTIAAALRNLGDRAGTVFAGEVTSVRAVGGVVEVDFRIDQSVKGQSSGVVVLREWTGLWSAGQRRYWVGERALVFLNPAGKDGLSSSVDGMEGILPLTSTVPAAVDVERIRTRVVRSEGAPMVSSSGSMSLADLSSAVVGDPTAGPLPIGRVPVPSPRPVHPLPIVIEPTGNQPTSRPPYAQPISTLKEYLDVPR